MNASLETELRAAMADASAGLSPAPDLADRVERTAQRRTHRVAMLASAAAVAAVVAGTLVGIQAVDGGESPGTQPGRVVASGPPTDAILFAVATSDRLDAAIEVAYVAAAGGNVATLTRASQAGMVATEPSWSPDGSRIAFVVGRKRQLSRHAGDGDIYVMNADGTGQRRLTDGFDGALPTWSPDGSQIAFVRNQGDELAIMRADGSDQHVIASARHYYSRPAWSPDGGVIAYQSTPDQNSQGGADGFVETKSDGLAVFTIRPDGTNERQLTPTSAYAWSPAWSPDGSQIAYSARDQSKTDQLWIMNVDGSGAHRVTSCRLPCVSDSDASWSPNGAELVFTRQEDTGPGTHLYILTLTTGAIRPLAPEVQWAAGPAWRPEPR